MKKIVIFILFLAFGLRGIGQSIMVIPFYKKDEDKRILVEQDQCYKTIESKIMQVFLEEGDVGLIDYLAHLRRIDLTDVRLMDAQSDLVTKLVELANPDIYIIVDIEKNSRKGNKEEYTMVLNLKASWTHNAEVSAVTLLSSGWQYYSQCYGLVEKTFQNKDLTNENKMSKFVRQLIEEDDNKSKNFNVSLEFLLDESAKHNYTNLLLSNHLLLDEITNLVKEISSDKKSDADFSSKYIRIKKAAFSEASKDGNVQSPSDIALSIWRKLSKCSFKDSPDSYANFEFDVIGNNVTFTLKN